MVDYKAEVHLIDVRTGEKKTRFLTKKEAEHLPFFLCMAYEYEDRKKQFDDFIKEGGKVENFK